MEKEKKQYKYLTKTITCPDGKRKYIRAKTKKELDAKVKAAREQIERGININDHTTFVELAQLWVDIYKRPHNREDSMKVILARVNNYYLPVLGALRVRDIQPLHIAQVMQNCAHLARSTQSTTLSDLRSIFNFAIEHRLLVSSPVPKSMKPGGEASKERVPLTPGECALLLRATEAFAEWLHTMVMLCLYTGLRVGEACGLCWDCVDLDKGALTVKRQIRREGGKLVLSETLKTNSSARELPIPPELLTHLRKVKKSAKGIAVVWGPSGLVDKHWASSVLSGIDIGTPVFPHLLRHTYATRLIEAGVDVKTAQYLLGHSTPQMTMEIYSHYDKKSRAQDTAKQVAAVSFVSDPVAKVLQIAEA